MNTINIIKDESSLNILMGEIDFKLSYVNLNNYSDLVKSSKYQSFFFTVDSSRLARFLTCDALMPDLSGYMEMLINNSVRILFIGGSKEEAALFEIAIKRKFPKTMIKVCDGFQSFNAYETAQAEFAPDTVVCSMGFSLQEDLILHLSESYSSPCRYLASGAFIAQTARNAMGYPSLIIRLNLRWLYRLTQERTARKRAFKILHNYIKLHGKKGSRFRHCVRF